MVSSKYLLLPATTIIALSLSGTAIAKQPKNHNNKHHKNSGSETRLLNSNKQSKLRGEDRAEERHEMADDRRDQKSRYNQYNQQNPVDAIIDRTMDNIGQTAKELTRGDPQYRH
jgi:hypothetical protein